MLTPEPYRQGKHDEDLGDEWKDGDDTSPNQREAWLKFGLRLARTGALVVALAWSPALLRHWLGER